MDSENCVFQKASDCRNCFHFQQLTEGDMWDPDDGPAPKDMDAVYSRTCLFDGRDIDNPPISRCPNWRNCYPKLLFADTYLLFERKNGVLVPRNSAVVAFSTLREWTPALYTFLLDTGAYNIDADAISRFEKALAACSGGYSPIFLPHPVVKSPISADELIFHLERCEAFFQSIVALWGDNEAENGGVLPLMDWVVKLDSPDEGDGGVGKMVKDINRLGCERPWLSILFTHTP